ncbi:hypothetical protein C8J56DRAFT_1019780 [Mycena floridula]|nr:hypothetical protein C8J56DRAFT_1019780 [Mycena floridula]
MVLTNIILLGAAGSLGTPLLKALLSASTKFKISVLARETSTSTFPANVSVFKADFSSHQSLVNALRGQDAVVITIPLSPTLEATQKAVFDAAVEAGVSHIIPSSYGADLAVEPGKSEAFLGPKVRGEDYLRQLAAEGKMNFTTIYSGALLDWALRLPGGALIGIDLVNKKATLVDDGTKLAMYSNLSGICDAVIGILASPERFTNHEVRIHQFFVTQRDILKIAEEELGTKFEVTNLDSDVIEPKARADFAAGVPMAFLGIRRCIVWGKNGKTNVWPVDDDSEAVGVTPLDLREEIVKLINERK